MTMDDKARWFQDGKKRGATHMCIIGARYDDYNPRLHYVMPGEDPRGAEGRLCEHESLSEVYALHLPMDQQLNEARSLHYESPPAKA